MHIASKTVLVEFLCLEADKRIGHIRDNRNMFLPILLDLTLLAVLVVEADTFQLKFLMPGKMPELTSQHWASSTNLQLQQP